MNEQPEGFELLVRQGTVCISSAARDLAILRYCETSRLLSRRFVT